MVDYSAAEKLAGEADLTILTLGITADLESEESPRHEEGFEGGDRTSINLPEPQAELLKRITALGKPVVLLTTSGSCLSLPQQGVNAWMQCWYPGEQGGVAVAKALCGEINPGGKLPVTFYRSVADLPDFTNYHMAGRTYRFCQGPVLFPFGYGLSYSEFRYGKASLKTGSGVRTVMVAVTNTSKVDGDEVVQVYARYDHPMSDDPVRRLVGFVRVHIAAGKTVQAKVPVTDWALRSWDEASHAYHVRAGGYELFWGTCARKSVRTWGAPDYRISGSGWRIL